MKRSRISGFNFFDFSPFFCLCTWLAYTNFCKKFIPCFIDFLGWNFNVKIAGFILVTVGGYFMKFLGASDCLLGARLRLLLFSHLLHMYPSFRTSSNLPALKSIFHPGRIITEQDGNRDAV